MLQGAFAAPEHPVWAQIAPELTPRDFEYPFKMGVEALLAYSLIRRRSKVPFRVVSDWRMLGSGIGAKSSAHHDEPCTALDLRVLSAGERFALVTTALQFGCTRIGLYAPNEAQIKKYGKNSGTVHLDFSRTNPQSVIWIDW